MRYPRIISEAKQSHGASDNIKFKAKELRKQMTDHEKILWSHIRRRQLNGKHFRRQHPFGIYIVDFYCHEAQLAIEIDGLIHLKRRKYDRERTEFLELSGLSVIRFTNKDIECRIEWVLSKIKLFLSNLPES